MHGGEREREREQHKNTRVTKVRARERERDDYRWEAFPYNKFSCGNVSHFT
jgi:hypothetical protein